MEVPVIDMSPFLEHLPNKRSITSSTMGIVEEDGSFPRDDTVSMMIRRREEVANQVRSACESHGFFYIAGLDDQCITTMSKAISQMKTFFDNDNQEFMNRYKEQCASKNSKLYRGYTQTGGGNNCVSASKIPELKESFTIGAEGEGKSPMHGPNLWPTTTVVDSDSPLSSNSSNEKEEEFCQTFRHDMANYFDHMLQLSRHVAHALALSLHLQGDFFTNRMTDPVAQLVTFKYPPEEKDEGGSSKQGSKQISCGEHTDCGFLTLLVQTAPGLEVYSKVTQTWHSIKPVENAVLVNLGDLTQFWTKGKYKSTPHRVHNRSRDGTNRYSLVFFANCDFDARLDDLDSTTSRDHTNNNCEALPGGREQQHQNENDDAVVTAGEYILEKLGLMWLMNKDK